MFFVLSKVLLFLLSPFFWLALAIGLYFYTKREPLKKRLKWFAIIWFFFFSNTFIFLETVRLWEVPGTKINQTKHYDVGIVLGGMAEYNNDLEVLSVRRSGDRMIQALSLYHAGKIDKILISGDSGHLTDQGLHEAKQFRELLISWNIPEDDILIEEISKNTYENAVETKKVLDKQMPEDYSALLITSGIHMRRAKACFDEAGVKCSTYSTDMYSGTTHNYKWDQYFIPRVDNFVQWQYFIKEIVGYMVYGLRGYL